MRRAGRLALLAFALAGAAVRAEEPARPVPQVWQLLAKADAATSVQEWKDGGLAPDALVLPTETEYNEPKQIEALEQAAAALKKAGAPPLWLMIGVSGQTLQVEYALEAAKFYVKRIPDAKGLVVHWLFPKRLLPTDRTADSYLREFADLGLPLIVMGDPEPARALEYTTLDYRSLEALAKVQGIAPDIYFSKSVLETEAHDLTIVDRWLEQLAQTSPKLPLYPCLRVGAPIESKPMTLEEFEAILGMVVKRAAKGIIVEGSAAKGEAWKEWSAVFRRVVRKG